MREPVARPHRRARRRRSPSGSYRSGAAGKIGREIGARLTMPVRRRQRTRSILATGLDRPPETAEEPGSRPVVQENVRGADYYAGGEERRPC
jgi:hypothetical protein